MTELWGLIGPPGSIGPARIFPLFSIIFCQTETPTKEIISLVHQPRDHSIYTWYHKSAPEAPSVPIGVAIIFGPVDICL